MATLAQDIAVYKNIPAAQRTAKQSAALATDLATQQRQTNVSPAPSSPAHSTSPTAAQATDPTWGVVSRYGANDVQAKLVASGSQVWVGPGTTAPAPGVTPAAAAHALIDTAGLADTTPTYYDPTTQQFFVEPVANAAGLNPAGTPQELAAAAEKATGAATPLAAQAAYTASLAPTPAATASPTSPATDTSGATPGPAGSEGTNASPFLNQPASDLSGGVGGGGSGDTSGGSAPSGSILSGLTMTDYLAIGGLALLAFSTLHRKGSAA